MLACASIPIHDMMQYRGDVTAIFIQIQAEMSEFIAYRGWVLPKIPLKLLFFHYMQCF